MIDFSFQPKEAIARRSGFGGRGAVLVKMQFRGGFAGMWEADSTRPHRSNTCGVIPRRLGYDRNLSETSGVSDPLCPVLLLNLPARTNPDFSMN